MDRDKAWVIDGTSIKLVSVDDNDDIVYVYSHWDLLCGLVKTDCSLDQREGVASVLASKYVLETAKSAMEEL